MVTETYISLLLQKYNPTEFSIGDQVLEVLTEFARHDYQSAYDVWSYIKDTHFPAVDYKNTHKRVKRLESLGYIEPSKVEEIGKKIQHGAIYYRITEAGLFQWFLHRNMLSLLPLILQIHGNYSIFKTLLYPYFTKETVLELKKISDRLWSMPRGIHIDVFEDVNFKIFDAIYDYLRDCCFMLFHFIADRFYKKAKWESHFSSLEDLDNQLIKLRNNLFIKILLWFSAYDKEKQIDAVAILAKDDKFMNIAYDIQGDLKRGFDIADHLRTKS
jgi:hypothetical protein